MKFDSKHALAAAAKHALWTAFRLRYGRSVAPLRVRAGPAQGAVLVLDVRTQGSYWLGRYDRWILDRVPLGRFVAPGQVAWDCGSFVGYYTSIFRALVGPAGRVIAFEASRANHAQVSRIPALNGWTNVEVRCHAVGPDHATLKFAGNLGGASGPWGLGKNFTQTGIVLESVTSCGVDELVTELNVPAPDFIKFDLETGEIHALQNGSGVFRGRRPPLLLELHGAEAMAAAGAFLKDYGYGASLIERLPEFSKVSPSEWDSAFESLASHGMADLEAIGYVPHMLFCLPDGWRTAHP